MSYGLNVEMHKQVRNETLFFFLGLVGKFYVGCFFKYNEVFEGGNDTKFVENVVHFKRKWVMF